MMIATFGAILAYMGTFDEKCMDKLDSTTLALLKTIIPSRGTSLHGNLDTYVSVFGDGSTRHVQDMRVIYPSSSRRYGPKSRQVGIWNRLFNHANNP